MKEQIVTKIEENCNKLDSKINKDTEEILKIQVAQEVETERLDKIEENTQNNAELLHDLENRIGNIEKGRQLDILKITEIEHEIDTNNENIEKIIEQYILTNLETYFDDNKLFNDNLHGGRRHHSTQTAVSNIFNTLLINKELGLVSTVLITDLSAAYDTVDTNILFSKLHHYGIHGKPNKLLHSFLTDRKQFVNLDTFSSILRNSPKCSTIQGSKLSGFLFNVYSNEIPLLFKLLNTDIYYKLGCKTTKINRTTHSTTSFVDDSTHIISFKDINNIRQYLDNYFVLLQKYYNINKLKLNSNKTKFMIVNNRNNDHFKNFNFMADNHKINPLQSLKILGVIIQNNLKIDKEINKITGQLNNRIHTIRQITHYTTFKTRIQFLNAFVIGKLTYMISIYSLSTKTQINKLQKLLNTAARAAIGSYCFKKVYHTC